MEDTGNNRVLEFKPPFSNGMNASVVIGQPNFTSNTPATNQSTLSNPAFQLAFDKSGNLWVSDHSNNRVLEFKPAFSNGMEASEVIGQPAFTTSGGGTGASNLNFPAGVAFAP